MLVQMPRGSSGRAAPQNAGECTSFEAALRRDLATAPVVSYDPAVGGWLKRIIDVTLTLALSPLWAPLLLLAIAKRRLQALGSPAIVAEPRVGYGGKRFDHLYLTPAPQDMAQDFASAPANDTGVQRDRWRALLQGLPMLLNVLRGEMSLVGPAALTEAELEPLRTARRYYLSARPGVIGVDPIAEESDDPSALYKTYARSWSLSLDFALMWEAARGLLRHSPPGPASGE